MELDNMKTKYCPYHNKKEPISNLYKNKSKPDGYAVQCKDASNSFTDRYEEKNRKAINEKSSINAKYYADKITRDQQIQLITKVNKKYGIKTRIK